MRTRRGQNKAGRVGVDDVLLPLPHCASSATSRTLQTPNGPVAAPLAPFAAPSRLQPHRSPASPLRGYYYLRGY